MTLSAPRLVLPRERPATAVVAFLEIAKAPTLLASLASKIPPDIVPMPVERLSVFCRGARGAAVALNGVVVCVPHEALPAEDRAIVDALAPLIPVLRIFDDPREAGRTFFPRCRDAVPRIPRLVDRLAYRRPVVVVRTDRADGARLLAADNLSPGGLFLKDPCLFCGPDAVLRLRFPGLTEVPEVVGRVRWVRTQRRRDQPVGYGCAFESPAGPAVRRLLAEARTAAEQGPPPPRRLPPSPCWPYFRR